MERTEELDDHERLKELCALDGTGSLSFWEKIDLELHLETCAVCRDLRDQYAVVDKEGMAFLYQNQPLMEEAERWESGGARERLFTSIRGQGSPKVLSIMDRPSFRISRVTRVNAARSVVIAFAAACLLVAVALGAYRIGERRSVASVSLQANVIPVERTIPSNKQVFAKLLADHEAEISRLQEQISERDHELTQLRSETGLGETRVKDLESLDSAAKDNLRQLTEERDKLAGQLGETQDAYQKLQTEFTSLKADYDRSLLHEASLESDVNSLTSLNRYQERRVKDDEQYLVSDRDIRELMGARKLYIADVFDVDSTSRTRKPFGRVFYTQNKSLVFYAFDLDHQPGVKNASDFQVWGQRDSESNGASHPMNLGILYMDSESNRRWVLRSDDPQQLAEIDAVFVTVEPHGGSQKPTGKPLLYALLRKEANHP